MSQAYFNWPDGWLEDANIEDTLDMPIVGMDLTAYVKVDMHETEACRRKAQLRARKKFAAISNCKPKFRRVEVIGEKTITLFTSRQIEYTIEVIADDLSVTEYYNNIGRYNANNQ